MNFGWNLIGLWFKLGLVVHIKILLIESSFQNIKFVEFVFVKFELCLFEWALGMKPLLKTANLILQFLPQQLSDLSKDLEPRVEATVSPYGFSLENPSFSIH